MILHVALAIATALARLPTKSAPRETGARISAKIDARIEAPEPKTVDKQFYLAIGALAASSATDSITTQRFLNRGCVELNPVYGPRPSAGRRVGTNLAYLGAEAGVAYALKRTLRNHRWLRHLWLIEPVWGSTMHAVAAARNEALTCR